MKRPTEIRAKAAAVAAALVFMGSLAWPGPGPDRASKGARTTGEVSVPSPVLPAVAAAKPVVWRNPAGPNPGGGWVYEVFTPPTVFHDAATGLFSLAPATAREEVRAPSDGDFELVAVQAELFPLQLSGYFGSESGWVVAFTNPDTRETSLARVGHRFESLGLTLVSFGLRRNSGREVGEVVGTAVLREDRTGEEVILESARPRYAKEPAAVLEWDSAEGILRVRAGEVVDRGARRFRVESVSVAPPEVVLVAGEGGEKSGERIVLRQRAKRNADEVAFGQTLAVKSKPVGTAKP